jgi:DNA invertase Pin-like site-specific DNA recombinase
MTQVITCAIYARKSTRQDADVEDKSVTRQVENARTFAAKKGWTVLDEHIYIDDGISGAAELTKLRAKAAMLAVIEAGAPFQKLVMQSNDRFSRRDSWEAMTELVSICDAGVDVWFYADNVQFDYGTMETDLPQL